ncbi:hypothetical protein AB0M47_36350 [Hamadaea sp. NPDC051192]|uniref:hypothetical protein n=1 Tax=Hamadaea sp. NPDC051192 TaxID=3154940 RepID=UPI00341E95E4
MISLGRKGTKLSTRSAQWLLDQIMERPAASVKISDEVAELAVWQAAFELAVVLRFVATTPVHEIAAYVQYMRTSFHADLKKIVPIEAEAMIRAALGEDLDLSGIRQQQRAHVYFTTFVLIVRERSMSEKQLRSILIKAENLARRRGFDPG